MTKYLKLKGVYFLAVGMLLEKRLYELSSSYNETRPDGKVSHVLRHTYASHFMQKGGNTLVLQQILGHSSITDTMKYSHFAPTHLEDAVKLNPLVVD